MHAIKPMKVGFLHRMFCVRGVYHFGVEVLLFTDFRSEGLRTEIGMWLLCNEELPGMTIGEGMPKSRAEFLVRGIAHPPGGASATCPVTASVGAVKKTLYVVGDRRWDKNGVPTAPEPFTAMPITWERAFGGEGFDKNPLGRGFAPVAADKSEVHHLPNVEHEGRLLRSPNERPDPASFMPIDFSWSQRIKKGGTYDQRWVEERFPGYPDDMDWTIFNSAPPDQWAPDFWAPDTSFAFTHLHPTKAKTEGRLPSFVARAFTIRGKSPKEEQRWDEVPLKLQTLWFFPHQEKLVMGFGGAIPCLEDDGSDVDWVLLAAEHAGRPKPESHYRRVMKERDGFEPEALAASMRESDLLPEGISPELEEALQFAEVATPEQLLRRNRMRGAIDDWEEGRKLCLAQGVDPDTVLGPPPFREEDLGPPKKMDVETAIAMALAQRKEADKKSDEARALADEHEARLREIVREDGTDPDEALEKARAELPSGPPVQRAADLLAQQREAAARLRAHGLPDEKLEARLADPKYFAELEMLEGQQIAAYRATAHLADESTAGVPKPAALAALRQALERELAAGGNFAGRDLTGADLSGLDLSDANFRGAFLEHANLTNTKCHDTDFRGAVLVRTRWQGAELARAEMADANLGRADFSNLRIAAPIDLTNAILESARVDGVSFAGCRLEGVKFTDAALDGVDFSGAHAPRLGFYKCTLRRVRFDRAELGGADFNTSSLEGLDFSSASIERASFHDAKADGCTFTGARARNVRLTGECSFDGCDFRSSDLSEAYMRSMSLRRARFDGATLDRADLSRANLENASFVGARGRHVRLGRARLDGANLSQADLMFANLESAHVPGASFRRANLFCADFGLVASDGHTDVSSANTVRVKVVPKRKSE